VFRERAAQQEIVQIQKQRQDKYRETEVHLLDKVLYEQSRKHADQVAAEKVKQTEREYLANVGKEVVDRKRADYMKSRTIGQKVRVHVCHSMDAKLCTAFCLAFPTVLISLL
jgi:hypothetical protein